MMNNNFTKALTFTLMTPQQRWKEKNREKVRLDDAIYRFTHAKERLDYQQKWRSPEIQRKHHLRHKFKITPEEYERMLIAQNGVCKLCLKPERQMFKGKIRRLAVDHCHTQGHIRGLLCTSCNSALGLINDNILWLHNAEKYLNGTL